MSMLAKLIAYIQNTTILGFLAGCAVGALALNNSLMLYGVAVVIGVSYAFLLWHRNKKIGEMLMAAVLEEAAPRITVGERPEEGRS